MSIQNPEEANDRDFRRRVRSHAVKQALQNKRNQASSEGNNFRSISLDKNPPEEPAKNSEKGTQTDRDVISPIPTAETFSVPADSRIAHALTLKELLESGMLLCWCPEEADDMIPQTKPNRR